MPQQSNRQKMPINKPTSVTIIMPAIVMIWRKKKQIRQSGRESGERRKMVPTRFVLIKMMLSDWLDMFTRDTLFAIFSVCVVEFTSVVAFWDIFSTCWPEFTDFASKMAAFASMAVIFRSFFGSPDADADSSNGITV